MRVKTLLGKLFILTLPFLILSILLPVCFLCEPMRYYSGEYPCYRHNLQCAAEQDGYNRVLICGDSTGKTSWLPSVLSDDTFNYALGGYLP